MYLQDSEGTLGDETHFSVEVCRVCLHDVTIAVAEVFRLRLLQGGSARERRLLAGSRCVSVLVTPTRKPRTSSGRPQTVEHAADRRSHST